MKRKRNSGNLPITWRGLALFLPLVWLFLMLSKRTNRPIRMNTINNIGLKVFHLLQVNGFSAAMAKLITAQAAHETGNFTSKIFLNNNNLFGMKQPKKRKTTATGTMSGHATFNTIEDAIKDFRFYHKALGYYQNYSSPDEYVKALAAKNYFEASEEEYKNGVKHFYNLYFGYGG